MSVIHRPGRPLGLLILLACLVFSGIAGAYAGDIGTSASPITGLATTDGSPGYITSQVFTAGTPNAANPANTNAACVGCHGNNGGAPGTVTLSTATTTWGLTAGNNPGPNFNVSPGTATRFEFTWTNQAGKFGGGFLVMHNDLSSNNDNGTLSVTSVTTRSKFGVPTVHPDLTVHACQGAADPAGPAACNGTTNNNTELMHEIPKLNGAPAYTAGPTLGASTVGFTFDYTPKAGTTHVCTTIPFALWVNSENVDYDCFNSSDNPQLYYFTVTVSCDDGVACTDDTCGATSCTHTNNNADCNDGDVCTTDTCNGAGCVFTDNTASCNDGNACTQTDNCNADVCTGTNPVTCASPPGQCYAAAGTCNTGTGACSYAPLANGTACNDGNACTTGDHCDGGGTCLAGGTVTTCTTPPNNQCYAATGTCNTGTGVCAYAPLAGGTSCSDGNACTSGDQCNGAGTCNSGSTVTTCTASDACHTAGTCNPANGTCSNPSAADGTPCNDGNACTQTDTCTAGVCGGANPKTCTASDACHVAGTCNPASGVCSNPNASNGTTCDDGNACTQTDTCTTGVCGGANPKTCTASDACHVAGTCNPASGVCSNPNASAGTTCDDGNDCTQTDQCNAGGTCVGSNPVVCAAPTACHTAGTCNPGTGVCSNPLAAAGAACNDNNACTQTDQCNAGGTCVGANPVVCGAPAQCHTAGTCNPADGTCSNPDAAAGTSCNDGNACTQTDQCNAGGICVGANPVVCAASDQCHVAGTCNTGTGACSNPNQPNGTACNDNKTCTNGEACQAGVCTGGAALDCSGSSDQCNTGVCNEPGGCAKQPLTGNTCDDGNACTTTDKCAAGVCKGGAALGCDDANACTTDTCDTSTGCVHTNVADTTPCGSDGNVCTLDTCLTGVCHTAVPDGTTSCGAAASCSGAAGSASAVPAVKCTAGVCPGQTPVSCGANPCNGTDTACQGSCGTDADCSSLGAPGFFCLGSTCTAKKGPGAPCSATDQCQGANTCVDNVCCTSACGGGNPTDCQTCNGTSPGTCTPQNATPCDDGVFCNGADTCVTGACTKHGANPCPGPDGDANCTESCNEAAKTCTANDPNGSACNDGKFCTAVDTCQAGVCGGTARDCTAFTDQCNTGVCNEAATSCQASPISGTSCDDGNACTTTDQCLSGLCTAGPAKNCNDSNVCTADSCIPATGCKNTALADNTACTNDGLPCTYDVCKGGFCNTPVLASDNLSCRTASCTGLPPSAQETAAATCDGTHGNCPAPVTTPCAANPCNGAACQGACAADANCPTGFFCNASQCVAVGGPGGSCSRDAMCQSGTTCVDSVCCTTACGGGDPTDCQTCNGTTPGTCTPQTGTSCDDKVFCDGTDTCSAGLCKVHSGSPCPGPDGDANCAESCNEAGKSCTANDPDTSPCSDGSACTVTDSCKAGVCVPGTALPCNDGNLCTDDSCDPASGCVFTNNTKACDDGNACTTTDTCGGGSCQPGPALACNDGNPCTVDSCDTVKGCIAPPGNKGTLCRAIAAGSTCDVPEVCDGANAACPPDVFNTGFACGLASCTGGTETLVSTCNGGSSQCPTAATQSCGKFVCGSTACLSKCTLDTDCASGNYCAANGQCTPKGNPGGACTAGNQCTSTFCTDGVCCNADCQGQCQACNLPASPGVCSPVTGKPVGTRPVCVGDNTGCDGTCNGVDPQKCAVPGASTQCRAPSCDIPSETATLAAVCDGSGSCPKIATQDCKPAVCGPTQCQGCQTDAQCGAGNFCRAGVCSPLTPPGQTCGRDAECASDHCVDGVCCNSDCTGQCEACNLAATPGVCTPVPANTAPVGTRTACNNSGTQCGGTCDGTNARTCAYPGEGVSCRAADCQSNRATLAASCDGAGNCPALAQQDCPPNDVCVGTLCNGPGSCTGDANCSGNQYCSGGVCVTKKDPGTSCNTAAECTSSECVDGFCCTTACTGQCEACDISGNEGTCTPVDGAPHGSRQSCASDGTVCAGTCDSTKNTPDTCTYKGGATSCRTASCANSVATLGATCQGDGSCAPLQLQSCDPNACDPGGIICAGGCTVDTDCLTGNYCSAGVCTPQAANGATCGVASQCVNGNCVDGVCCDSACTGQCSTCDKAGFIGICSPISGAPRDGRPACAGSGACGGFCDGTNGNGCSLPNNTTTCGVAFCTDGFATDTPACNGNGTCLVPTAQSCDPYTCDPKGPTCLTNCQLDTDCATGLVCLNGNCSQPVIVAPPDGGADASTGTGGTATGTGGAVAVGGARGTSGVDARAPGQGGVVGTGGTTRVDAGAGGQTGSDAGVGGKSGIVNGQDRGSCGCRVPGTNTNGTDKSAAYLAGLALLLLGARRRGRGERPSA